MSTPSHTRGQPGSPARYLSRHHPPWCESGPLRPALDARHHMLCPMSNVRGAAIDSVSVACPLGGSAEPLAERGSFCPDYGISENTLTTLCTADTG